LGLPAIGTTAKDWLQVISWLAVAFGLVVAVIRFRVELRLGREQRERELRWKQAEAGKELNDEMLDDPLAWPALQMADYGGRSFQLPSSQRVSVTDQDVRYALHPGSSIVDEKHIFIRDCFDNLFYSLAMFDHYIDSALVRPEDVSYPIEYYVPRLRKFAPEIDGYLEAFELHRARKFLRRYQSWRDVASPGGASNC
jgi:hypothetical protein